MKRISASKMIKYNVYINDRYLTSVFFEVGFTAEEVRQSLINHDGYSTSITVTKA
jgi:hypothetical protein